MSHFASHPYHTMPTIHSSRNNHPLPLSPPETDQESLPVQLPPGSLVAGAELEQLGHPALSFPERSKFQSRKTSSLSYQNSGARDNRDRTPSRASKSLIVVLPPPDFPVDHGQLGTVLSMGPHHRLSQGMLMPLFPTVGGPSNQVMSVLTLGLDVRAAHCNRTGVQFPEHCGLVSLLPHH